MSKQTANFLNALCLLHDALAQHGIEPETVTISVPPRHWRRLEYDLQRHLETFQLNPTALTTKIEEFTYMGIRVRAAPPVVIAK